MSDRRPRAVLLVSPDLLAATRLAGLAEAVGTTLETIASPMARPRGATFDLVLLDLQGLPADLAATVGRCRMLAAGEPPSRGVPVIAFGPHVWHERLAGAVAAGADAAVSRGELLGTFADLVRRWAGAD